MRIREPKTANLLRVDPTFASLVDIEGDDIFIYEFAYFTSTVSAIRLGANIVRISVRTELPIPEREIFRSLDNEGNTGAFVSDILRYEAQRKDSHRFNRAQAVATTNSDITANINNETARAIADTNIPANQVLGSQRIFVLQSRADADQQGDSPPIMQVASGDPDVSAQSVDPQVAAFDLIYNSGVDPSSIGEALPCVNGAFSANGGSMMINRPPGFNALGFSSPVDGLRTGLVKSLLNNTRITLRAQNLAPETLIPRIASAQIIYVRSVKTMQIPRRHVGIDDFFVVFELIDSSGTILETVTERVRHNQLSRIFSIPQSPPRVTVAGRPGGGGCPGRNIVSIEQTDPIARRVRLYRRSLNSLNTQPINSEYRLLSEFPLRKSDGAVQFADFGVGSHANLYRVVALGPGGVKGPSFDNVVAPAIVSGDADGSNRPRALSLSASNVLGAVELLVGNVSPSVVSIAIMKRDVTIHEREFSFLDVPEPVRLLRKKITNLSFLDRRVSNGHIYEYIAKLYYVDGSIVNAGVNIFQRFVKTIVGAITANVTDINVVRSGRNIDVTFNVQSRLTETNLDAVKRALIRQGLDDLFENELISERNKLQKLIAHNIQRINFSTGEVEDFGTFTGVHFSDMAAGKGKNVKPIRDNSTYKYMITTLLRSAETMFEELRVETADLTTGKSYDRNPAKYDHPLIIAAGTISDPTSRRRAFAEDEFSFGRVGNVRIVPITIGTSSPKIRDVTVRRVDARTASVRWRVDGNSDQIEHFIIVKELLGMRSIAGKVHHVSSGNTHEFFDKLTSDDIGEITYSVVPVLNDYQRGVASTPTGIVVKDGRI